MPPPFTPTVGRSVHYYDREEFVVATGAGRPPQPFAAIVTRVLTDDRGQPTRVCTLAVFDPEIGVQVQRDVSEGEADAPPNPHRWYAPVIVQPVDEAPTHAPTNTKKR
jgi:hypothetical protein